MSFTTVQYLLFAVVVAAVYWRIPRTWRAWYLTACSYGFYITWNAPMAAVLAALTGICYSGSLVIERLDSESKKGRIAISLTLGLVAFIVFFKLLPLFGSTKEFLIPLGVSYYTFKLISYVLDVYWGVIPAEHNIGRFAAFVAFFPQIVAGPIQRSESFFEQFENAKAPRPKVITIAAFRILVGLFKKMFIADRLGVVVDPGYAAPNAVDGVARLISFYVFPIQLYADFSALTDISNGTALLLGMEGVENFEAPFIAPSISDYWRRWHMSLTGWLRDYVFTPLRMSLRDLGNTGLVLSVCGNMMLVALWHGFSAAFVVFGLIHSFFLSIDAVTIPYRKRLYKTSPRTRRVAAILGPIVTYHIVALGNTFFRARTFEQGWQLITGLYRGLGRPTMDLRDLYLGLAGFFLVEFADYARRRGWQSTALEVSPRWTKWFAYSGVAMLYVFAIAFMYAKSGVRSPFMYAGF
jgi:hypothetical protein